VESSDSILVKDLKVSAYKIPTATPEADGTIEWDSTTLVLVEINAADKIGSVILMQMKQQQLLLKNL
jgi:hypothetical protein